jgi:DNA (cytosine-5)-methyltransferase 1
MNNNENTIFRAEQTRVIGCMPGYEVANRVYDTDYLAPTIRCYQGGGLQPKFIEVSIVAQRGRGLNNEQQLEERADGLTNTITTVQKDNMVLVKQATKDGYIECEVPGIADLNYVSSTTRRGRVQENGKVSPTIATENCPSVIEPWIWEIDGVKYKIRIRKLTAKECWRLQGFSDEDFEKAASVNSNTQLYKQAGNSITKDVLMAIFSNLF